MHNVSYGSTHLKIHGYPADPVLFVEKAFLSPLNYSRCLCQIHLAVYVQGNFWISYCVPLIYFSNFIQLSQCLNYYIVSLKVREYINPSAYFFSKIALATLSTLHFHIYFSVHLSISMKIEKSCWNFDWCCTDL